MEEVLISTLLLRTAENATAVSHYQIHPSLLTNPTARGPAQQHWIRLVEALDI